MSAQAPPATDLLLAIADDELVLGWRDSEWTGIAPFLEEDVALSSIAQTEIGHARALYEVVAAERGATADELAFDREPADYRAAPLVQLHLVDDWAGTIARRYLYETADALRIAALKDAGSPDVAGLAVKIEREEAYHLMHAGMWIDRLLAADEGRRRLEAAVDALWPAALGVLDDPTLHGAWVAEVEAKLGRSLPDVDPVERGSHDSTWPALWDEMTMVRRSAPGSAW